MNTVASFNSEGVRDAGSISGNASAPDSVIEDAMSASVGGIVLRDSARAAEKAFGVTKAIAHRVNIGSKRITPKMQLLKHRVAIVVGKFC